MCVVFATVLYSIMGILNPHGFPYWWMGTIRSNSFSQLWFNLLSSVCWHMCIIMAVSPHPQITLSSCPFLQWLTNICHCGLEGFHKLVLCRSNHCHSPGNDHRWTSTWDRLVPLKGISRVFDYKDSVNWKSKLGEVHKDAWNKWQKDLSSKALYSLPAAKIQQGGVIPEDVYEDLSSVVAAMPSKTKYHKKL